MKVTMYMAITANGYIAKEDDDTSWVTATEWASYSGAIRKSRNMIIGRRTYEIMVKNGDFDKPDLNNVRTVVVTSDARLRVHDPRSVLVAASPRKAIDILRKQGFRNLMVCGGGGLNASFMKDNLVDELFLDVEPILIGKGIKLFAEQGFEAGLRLVGAKKLSKNEIQLHYTTIKKR